MFDIFFKVEGIGNYHAGIISFCEIIFENLFVMYKYIN